MLPVAEKHERALILDLLVGVSWMLYAFGYLMRAVRSRGLIDTGLLLFFTLLAVMFLIRRPARKSGTLWETLLAFTGTVLPPIVLRPVSGGLAWTGAIFQGIGVVGMTIALISLGRSFGIAPADRGLRTVGLYRWIRHPLYASELCFYVGYLMANPSVRNLLGLVASTMVQIVRIWREEHILEGYERYAEQVRHRLIPYVW